MKKFLKIVAWLAGIVILAIVAAVIIIPLVVDPNDYRDDITNIVKKHTGRDLVIEGDIGLSVFPWLGLELGATRLSNAEGFGPEPFARLEEMDLKVKLLPLLSKRVEMDTIALRGLEVNLARSAKGVTNWADLTPEKVPEEAPVTPEPEAKEPGATPAEALAALAIGGVQITDAKAVWDDRMADQRFEVSNFNLETGELSFEAPIPVSLSLDLASSKPQMNSHVAFKSEVSLNLEQEIYRLINTTLEAKASGAAIPGGSVEAELATDIVADLKAQTASVSPLTLNVQGAELTGQVQAEKILSMPDVNAVLALALKDPEALLAPYRSSLPEGMKPAALKGARLDANVGVSLENQTLELKKFNLQALDVSLDVSAKGSKIIDAPSFAGQIKTNEFVPREVIETVGVKLPEMADPSVLTKASLSSSFNAGLDHAGLNKLNLRFDDSTLAGSALIRNFTRPVIRYDLTLNEIDVDRYLPPPTEKAPEEKPVTPGTAATAGATELPLETLRGLDIDGTFRLNKLKVVNLRSSDIHATLKAENGLFRVHPVGAKLYQGAYTGDLRLDVTGKVPVSTVNERLSGVQAGPLLKDFMGKDYVTGTANVSAQMSARGLEPMEIRKSLNGNAAFSFENGAVKGLNVAQLIREAYAKFKGQPKPKEEAKQTDFSVLKGSVTVKDGLVRNEDLTAMSPLLRVSGRGTAHLVTEKLDYDVDASIVGTLEGQGGQEAKDLKNVTIPLAIRGTFSEPEISVDLERALGARAREALEKEKQRLQEEAQRKIDAEKKRAEEQAKKKIEEEKKRMEKDLQKGLEDELKKRFQF